MIGGWGWSLKFVVGNGRLQSGRKTSLQERSGLVGVWAAGRGARMSNEVKVTGQNRSTG